MLKGSKVRVRDRLNLGVTNHLGQLRGAGMIENM